MYHNRRPSTASSISSTHSDNQITKTMRSAHHRLSRHRPDKTTTATASSSRSPTPPGHLGDSGRKSSTCSERSCSHIPADNMNQLWQCMLELQDEYGCYNSTRMEVAMEAGEDAMALMPSRFIIDTLNDSVADNLPDEGWEKLDRYLRQPDEKSHK